MLIKKNRVGGFEMGVQEKKKVQLFFCPKYRNGIVLHCLISFNKFCHLSLYIRNFHFVI